MKLFKGVISDPRHFQIAYLGTFLLFGCTYLQWKLDLHIFLSIMCLGISLQYIGDSLIQKPSAWKSAVISVLGICILLKTSNSLWMYVGVSVAIASKFLLRFQHKHIFNPVNISLVLLISLSGEAWVSPGQWGSQAYFIFIIGTLGGFILFKVSRWDVSLSFLGTLFLLEFTRTILYQGWPLDMLLQKFSSGTLLLFTFFMITDPVTTPNALKARILWGIGVAILSFVLTSFFFIHTAPIWALFIVSFSTPFFNIWIKSTPFKWNTI